MNQLIETGVFPYCAIILIGLNFNKEINHLAQTKSRKKKKLKKTDTVYSQKFADERSLSPFYTN